MANEVFQIAFPGMEIDEEQTFKKVEEHLETAALYKRMGYVRREATMTPSYSVKENTGFTGITKQTENIALHNTDGEDRAKRTYDKVMLSVSKLRYLQKEIITKRFLGDPDVIDINVWIELNLSERTYYRLKSEAMAELAYALRLEVIK